MVGKTALFYGELQLQLLALKSSKYKLLFKSSLYFATFESFSNNSIYSENWGHGLRNAVASRFIASPDI